MYKVRIAPFINPEDRRNGEVFGHRTVFTTDNERCTDPDWWRTMDYSGSDLSDADAIGVMVFNEDGTQAAAIWVDRMNDTAFDMNRR